MSKLTTPKWIEEGPLDLEYKSYKFLQRVKELEGLIQTNLMEALWEIDDTLDYLYRYDAIKQTDNESVPEMGFIGFPMDDLEMVFTTEEDMDTNDIVDMLYEEAIDKFEELHEALRKEWRNIEDGLVCSYLGNKKHFLSGGFVFISTPDNKLHVYFFNKPSKSFKLSWKDFKMEHIATKEYDEVEYFKTLEELGSAKSDRILIKANLKTHTNIHGHAITVVNSVIFNMLHRDYSF
tara:strand:- start:419 stop:1123 length:705 start_codon:yes stop_codon:yes gene_type:complete